MREVGLDGVIGSTSLREGGGSRPSSSFKRFQQQICLLFSNWENGSVGRALHFGEEVTGSSPDQEMESRFLVPSSRGLG